MFGVQGWGHPPGQDVLRETIDNTLWWGPSPDNVLLLPRKISSAVTDPGNTGNTNILRAGLLLARSTADFNVLVAYDRAGSATETDNIVAVLAHSVDTEKFGTAGNLWVGVIVGGPIVAKRTINPTSGDANTIGGWVGVTTVDPALRASFASTDLLAGAHRFILDDFDADTSP